MEIRRVERGGFSPDSMLSLNRRQVVKNVYRLSDGRLSMVYHPFEEDWTAERKREKAAEILSGRFTVFCAYDENRVVGEIMLLPELNEGRMIVDSFHVSEEFRRRGIGRALFEAARTEARKHGARALYLSACSAQETIDFIRRWAAASARNPFRRMPKRSRAIFRWNARRKSRYL